MAKAKTGKNLSFNDVLRLTWKHIFWIVIPILILIAYSVKKMAQGKIKTDYESETSQVTAEKKAMDDIASNAKHPNNSTIEKVKAEEENLSENVYKTWMLMFSDQKKRNKWPRKLSREFLDIVENSKFESPIGTGRQYILEDYGRMMVNNLPELLIDVNRRRYQVRCYQFVRSDENPNTGRFEPVYIDHKGGSASGGQASDAKPLLYLFGNNGKVYQYFQEDNYIAEIQESGKREYLLGIPKEDRVDYWVETDPMITNPREFVSAGDGLRGGMGGMSGPMGMMGPGGGMPSALGGGLKLDNASIPGNGIDPALNSLNISGDLSFDRMTSGTNEVLPGLPPYVDRRRMVGNVDWLSPEIFELLNWGSSVPYSIEVWYLQEDLWVYQALLRVVMKSNGVLSDAVMEGTAEPSGAADEETAKKNQKGSDANNIGKSAIKCIEQMLIGQRAAEAWSEIKNLSLVGMGLSAMAGSDGPPALPGKGVPGTAPGPGGPGMMPGAGVPGMPPGPGGPGMMGGGSALDETTVRTSLRNYRYLDAADEPLGSDDPAPFAEFKRMPICLKLIVDQRRIPEILVNCANCSMPIDIRQVRIRPENGMSQMGGAFGMGGPMGGMSRGGGMPGGMSGGMPGVRNSGDDLGGVSLGRSELGESSGYGADAIRISIYGVINIYNEPNPEVFGTGSIEGEKTEEEKEGAEKAEAETPPTPDRRGAAENAASAASADADADAKSGSGGAPATPPSPENPIPVEPGAAASQP